MLYLFLFLRSQGLFQNLINNPKISNSWFESTAVCVSESKIIKKAIANYVNKSKNVFNSADIARYVVQIFNITLQKKSIIKFF